VKHTTRAVPGKSRGSLVLPVLVIAVGTGWLLTARGIGPDIDWVWTLGLGAAGILTFVVSGGVDKFSVVFGPFLLAGSFLSLLRQRGSLAPDTEVPILVILLGILLFLARMSWVPAPQWATPAAPAPPDEAPR